MMRALFALLMFAAGAIALGACAHLPSTGPSVLPSSSPYPTTSPSPAPSGSPQCESQASNATVIVAMSLSIAPTTAPTYGVIYGYTAASASTGTYNNVASVIDAKVGDVVQFANAEAGSTPISHSAVGFPNATSFPATPYSFPASTQSLVGTQISKQQWSTGIIDQGGNYGACFSPPFTVSTAGTYFFGDYQYYNLNNMRGVIVVSQ
jgi:hypothetical protein